MSTDPIHDALSQEPAIEPDAGFKTSVMMAVRREASLPPIAFPWRRFVLGFALSMAAAVAIVWLGPRTLAAPPDVSRAFGWAASALFGCWACYAVTSRWTNQTID